LLLGDDAEVLGDPGTSSGVAVSPRKVGWNAVTYWRSTSAVSRSGSTVTSRTCTRSPSGAERLHDRRQLREGGRADIRTVGEAEEHNDRAAGEVGQRAHLAIVPRQLQFMAEVRARDVHDWNDGTLVVRTGCQRNGAVAARVAERTPTRHRRLDRAHQRM
jgi:hypothetical protein